MSTKTLRRELLVAIAMVIVAAIALGSSTYAWFANNAKVTATGLTVQATSEGGIEIVPGKASDANVAHATLATTKLESALLLPTSTYDTIDWYHASAKLSAYSEANDETRRKVAEGYDPETGIGYTGVYTDGKYVYTDDAAYYLMDTFNIRSTSSESIATGLKVSKVTVTGDTKDMSAALRVAVKLEGGKTLIFAPVEGATDNYAVYTEYTEGSGTTLAGKVTLTECEAETLIAAEETTEVPAKAENGKNGGVDVQIYVYFEGEDEHLYSDNFGAEDLTVTVEFSATI